jgi:cytochrome c
MKKTMMIASVTAMLMTVSMPVVAQAGAESRCKSCHAFTDKNKMGPGLKGVYGKKAGTQAGYKYKFTKYIKGDGWVWDEEHLRAWILDSKKAVKEFTGDKKAKTKMAAQHIKGKKADEIIAFLKGLK